MAKRHPYAGSTKGLNDTIERLRKSFPATVTSETLQKLGFAPKSERQVINVLEFLRIIDDNGNGMESAKDVFLQHDDAVFQERFGDLVLLSYAALFDAHGDNAWQLPRDRLIQFFRNHDGTTAVVGGRQAKTFSLLCTLSGYGEPGTDKSPRTATKAKPSATKKSAVVATSPAATPVVPPATPQVGLTVRIELNLPADGSQETYDHIFKSIRENFLDG